MARVFVSMENYLRCSPGCGRDGMRTVTPASRGKMDRKREWVPSRGVPRYTCVACGEEELLIPEIRIHVF